jgi:hypothetical protein
MVVKIVPTDHTSPYGKVADAELHFTDGPLEGLRLIGFSVWQRRTGVGFNVTFPARSYSVNGERRSFALLRPIVDVAAQDRVREAIIAAYEADVAGPVERATNDGSIGTGPDRRSCRCGRTREQHTDAGACAETGCVAFQVWE